MKNSQIHPTALIEEGVSIGAQVTVDAYAIIENGAKVGDGCHIHSHAMIKKYAVLGRGVEVGHFAVVGGDPQHLGFDRSISSSVVLEDDVRLGEGVTLHRSIEKGGETRVGKNCFLMGYSHVAHDCSLGERVVLANGALLGGHVSVARDVFLGGGAAVHQFVRIGQGAMIGGLSEISLDIPPQVLVSGRNLISGLNLIGMKRRKIPPSAVSEIKNCFREVMENGNLKKIAKEILNRKPSPSGDVTLDFLNFFLTGKRGFARLSKKKSPQVDG